MSRATVVFVGAGTGDPRLLTLRGRDAIAEADAVVRDPAIDPEVLVHARPDAARHVARAPAAALIGDVASRASRVVRLVAGDVLPAAEDEIHAVARAGHAFEIAPGVTALAALPAFTGVALNRASDVSPSFVVVRVDGEIGLHDWDKLAAGSDTVVVFAQRGAVDEVVRSLVYHGRDEGSAAAAVTSLGRPSQRTVVAALRDLAAASASLPEGERTLIVGDVVAARSPLVWFDARPLFGKRVLVTRALEQAGAAAALLRERGAEPVLVPTIEIHPPPDPAPLRAALARLATGYDWVAFTSANTVARVWRELAASGRDARAFGAVRIASVGPGTAAALEAHGLVPDAVAKELRGEGVAAAILASADPARPPRVLFPRARVAREALPDALRAAGSAVDVVTAYETRPAPPSPDLERDLAAGAIDAATFTSSSTADNLCDLLGARAADLLARPRVAAIGELTAEALRRRGVRVDVVPAVSTVPALIDALERSFA